MKSESPKSKYEFPIEASAWTKSVWLGAGIYFLEGRTHVAGHSSAAERELIDRGALLIATLRFERDPLESSHTHHPISALAAGEAVRRFGNLSSSN